MPAGKIILLLLLTCCAKAQFIIHPVDSFPLPVLFQYTVALVNEKSFAYGQNNQAFLAGITNDSLVFQRSSDGGKSWPRKPIAIVNIKGAHTFPGQVSTAIACDTSGGANNGRIYICWSDTKHGAANSDVFLIYSDDNGTTWTEPVLVTYRPNHREQFAPAIAVDGVSGRVYLLYYDRQNYSTAYNVHNSSRSANCDIYLATSINGLKFDYYKINTQPVLVFPEFKNRTAVKVSPAGEICLYWKSKEKEKKAAGYKCVVNDSLLRNYDRINSVEELAFEKTIPFADEVTVRFSCKSRITLTAIITKPLEPGFEKNVVRNKRCKAGYNKLRLNMKALGLSNDNYILTVYYHSKNTFAWILKQE